MAELTDILCDRCIHKKKSWTGNDQCRMQMAKRLQKTSCAEYIDKCAYVENTISKCYPTLFGEIYMALRRSDEKHHEFYQKYCKKCANKTGKNWCKRFARLTSELSR